MDVRLYNSDNYNCDINIFVDNIIEKINKEKYLLDTTNYYHLYNNIMYVLLYNIENNFIYQKFLMKKIKNVIICIKKYKNIPNDYHSRIEDETDVIIDNIIVSYMNNVSLNNSSYVYFEILKKSLYLTQANINSKKILTKISKGYFNNWYIITDVYNNKIYIKKHINNKTNTIKTKLCDCKLNTDCNKCSNKTIFLQNKRCNIL